jgi:hypothetical protein
MTIIMMRAQAPAVAEERGMARIAVRRGVHAGVVKNLVEVCFPREDLPARSRAADPDSPWLHATRAYLVAGGHG